MVATRSMMVSEGPPIFRTANPLRFASEREDVRGEQASVVYSEYKREAAKMVVDTSRPVATVAREQGVNEQSLRNWVNEYRAAHAEEEPPLTVSERARLRELEKEVRELRLEKEFLGESRGLLRAEVSVTERYHTSSSMRRRTP